MSGFLDISDAGGITFAPAGDSPAEERNRVFDAATDRRIQPEGFVQILDGQTEQALIGPREPPVAERVGVGGLFANRAVEIGDRTVEIAELEKDDAAVVVGVRVLRVEPNRLVVVAPRQLEVFARSIGVSTIVERVGRVRVEANRFVIIANRAIDVPDAPIRNAPVYVRAVIARIQKNDFRARIDGGRRSVSKTLTPCVGLRACIGCSSQTYNAEREGGYA